MSKLLHAAFRRLWKNKNFWSCMIFMAAMGIITPIIEQINVTHWNRIMPEYSFSVVLEEPFFNFCPYIGVVTAVFVSLFMGIEYSDGTMRNKILVGHSRISVYLSNLSVCIVGSIALCLSYMILAGMIGASLFGFFETDIRIILMNIIDIFAMIAAFSALFTFVSMLNKNRALTAVICILGAVIFLFMGAWLQSTLQEPEMWPEETFLDDNGEIVVIPAEPNPNYLVGTEREVCEFLYDFLPGGQALQLNYLESQHPWRLGMYSIVIVIASAGVGVVFFKRKDLN